MTDEIFQERQLEDYNLERMTPQERQEIWEQQQLNEQHANSLSRANELSLDNLQQYATYVEDQLRSDEYDQTMQINDMQDNDQSEER